MWHPTILFNRAQITGRVGPRTSSMGMVPLVQPGKSTPRELYHIKLCSEFGPSDVRSDGPNQENANDGPGWTTDLFHGDDTPRPTWKL
ncbi:unnamed protein product [Sphagnum balticum]